MASENKWFVQRFGPDYYLCRVAGSPIVGESSYEDWTNKTGDRIYYQTHEAAEARAETLNADRL